MSEAAARAQAFAAEMVAAGPRSPAFAAKVTDIETMGEPDLRATAQFGGRPDVDATAPVVAALGQLRQLVDDLDPAHLAAPSGVRRLLGGRGEAPDRYFARYEAAQERLDSVLVALRRGHDDLLRHNAAIETERAAAAAALARLDEYTELAGALGDALEQAAAGLDADAASVLRTEAVTAARRRQQDILTHRAVVTQGQLALDVVHHHNTELIQGIERTRTGTVRALRAAVAAARADHGRTLLLDRIRGVDTAAAEGDLDGLRSAFADLRATMDGIERDRTTAQADLAALTGGQP
jgi:uncharacterized protein YaaN involved in tellurite resistance